MEDITVFCIIRVKDKSWGCQQQNHYKIELRQLLTSSHQLSTRDHWTMRQPQVADHNSHLWSHSRFYKLQKLLTRCHLPTVIGNLWVRFRTCLRAAYRGPF